jgi:spoIIIJ-associated protein
MTDPAITESTDTESTDTESTDTESTDTESTDTESTDTDPAVADSGAADPQADPHADPQADPLPSEPAEDPADGDALSALEREGEVAADYLEELLDIADLDGDIDMDVERDRAVVSIVGGDLDDLVGRDGAVLEALQELTRLAVLTSTGSRSRLMLDVAGFRAGRRAVLTELGRTTAEQVRSSGEAVRLEPMSPFERKVVHDAVADAGLRSESEGEEPRRYVVVLPA